MKRRIPLNTLRAFEAVGRHCHVRRAAEELHLTHAAVSRQVKILEERLGVQLFSRENNRVQLTLAGQRFLAVVQRALQALEDGVLHIDPESIEGELVIATTPTISTNWLPEVIAVYNRDYPEVEVRCITIEPQTRKLPRQFDLALCLGEPDGQGMESTRLYREQYSPVCAPGLLDRQRPVKKPGDLLAYPLLHERYQHWEEWFALHGITGTGGIANIHFDYGFQSIEAARRGLGVVLADQLEVSTDLKRGSLINLLDQSLPVGAGVYLVTHRRHEQSIRARLFEDELRRCLGALGIESVTTAD